MGNNKKQKLLIPILLAITIVAVAIAIWALCSKEEETGVLTPTIVPEIDQNVEDIPNDSTEKMEQPEGGGSVSITFSKDVNVDLSTGEVKLLFANPGKSNMDMVLEIIVQDEKIVQTGALKPGKQLSSTMLLEGAEKKLTKGIYEGKFNVLYYSLETGAKATVNTEIPVSITVN